MFIRLVQKELLHYLLDFRFIAVFALCVLLSVLGVYVGSRNYLQQRRQYDAASEKNRNTFQSSLERDRLHDFWYGGLFWNRPPEVLSTVVYGLSGEVGQEVRVQYRHHVQFEGSLFATDPIHALFGVLDLAFVVKFVLSLCVVLFTYDAVCGEKEAGTLRLHASFPVSRSTLALAKLVGSTVAVLIPLVFSFLVAAVVLALSPELELQSSDWGRMATLTGVFGLYLMVFAGFGLSVSALTHRRAVAFLGLLGLWVAWLFVVPNLAVDIARRLAPVTSIYSLERRSKRRARPFAQSGRRHSWTISSAIISIWVGFHRVFGVCCTSFQPNRKRICMRSMRSGTGSIIPVCSARWRGTATGSIGRNAWQWHYPRFHRSAL